MNINRPPKSGLIMLGMFLPEQEKKYITGGLRELFNERAIEYGRSLTLIWFWKEVLVTITLLLFDRIERSKSMFKNYLKIAVRNIRRYKWYSFINVSGLAIGIACSILIALFVRDELSYDSFHEKKDRIFRIGSKVKIGDVIADQESTSAILNPTLRREFSEIRRVTTVRTIGNYLVQCEDKAFKEEKVFIADTSFFEIFTFRFTLGDRESALSQPNSVVITESMSKKYFSDENPVGRILNIENRDFIVTGVIENLPLNSHIQFDFVLSSLSFNDFFNDSMFTRNNFVTYIELQDNFSYRNLEAKLSQIAEKYIYRNNKDLWKGSNYYKYYLQPLNDIHLIYESDGAINRNTRVYIYLIIAIFFLLIACINFMNLTTAFAARRRKEVEIRKVVGSHRKQLIMQFMSEALVLSFISLALALLIVEALIPVYENFAGKKFDIVYSSLQVVVCLIGFGLIIGLISGCYPAFFLSRFNHVSVLSRTIKGRANSSKLRNGLVIFQFSISTFLIICTIIVYNQM
ncbi:ABC transporter permease, partial [candidate division KSB1 bacterium]